MSVPPGAVVELAKATVAIRVATTEHDVAVLISQSPPSFTRHLWLSEKSSFGVSPFLLVLEKMLAGIVFSTYYINIGVNYIYTEITNYVHIAKSYMIITNSHVKLNSMTHVLLVIYITTANLLNNFINSRLYFAKFIFSDYDIFVIVIR